MVNKLLIVLCALCFALPAKAETLQYAVYASGFQVVDLNVNLQDTSKNYHATLNAGLHGWLKKMAPWYGVIETKGILPSSPRSHSFLSSWRGKKEVTRFTYGPKGYVSGERVEENGAVTKLPAMPDLTDGSVDIVSTLYIAMQALDKTGSCSVTRKVFDGRRSFDIRYKQVGSVKLKKSKYNVFEGEAQRCTVEIKPLKGKWHDKPRGWLSVQEQSRLKGQLPTLTFGKVRAKGGYAPVKAELQTRFGGAVLHLTAVTN